jgi:hypothetical protein
MKSKYVVAAILGVAAIACGKSAEEQQVEEAARKIEQGAEAIGRGAEQMAAGAEQSSEQMAQGLAQMAAGFQQMAQNANAKVVDFEHLKALLPELDGWTRSDERGEQLSMPVSYSRAEAIYRRDDSRLELEIVDTALSQMLLAPMSMFLASGYAERSDDGFKRAAKIGGHPGLEDWSIASKRGEVTAVVGQRYIVRASGDDVADLAPIRQLVEAVDLGKLAQLK